MTTLQGLFRPRTVIDAAALLAQDEDAKIIAGGGTLVAMVNARVITPACLVSLAGIDEIKGITQLADGRIRVGAFTRHRETAECTLELGAAAVVRHAASQIANATVRNMGTIGGSVSFADPGLDYPPALVAAGAVIEVANVRARRLIEAKDFFVDWYTTALEQGELVTAVFLPKPTAGSRGLYLKHARVAGDYATASVAACLFGDGRISVTIGGCGPTPLFDERANALLSASASDTQIAQAASILQELADPLDDVRGTAEYRRRLIAPMLRQAVREVCAHQGVPT